MALFNYSWNIQRNWENQDKLLRFIVRMDGDHCCWFLWSVFVRLAVLMLPTVEGETLHLRYPAVPSEHFLLPRGSARTGPLYRTPAEGAWQMAGGETQEEVSMLSVSVVNSTVFQTDQAMCRIVCVSVCIKTSQCASPQQQMFVQVSLPFSPVSHCVFQSLLPQPSASRCGLPSPAGLQRSAQIIMHWSSAAHSVNTFSNDTQTHTLLRKFTTLLFVSSVVRLWERISSWLVALKK